MAESAAPQKDDTPSNALSHYSEFETLYESVLFKKPELLTSKVFVNAMNEIKLMREKVTTPSLSNDLAHIDELLSTLYLTVQRNFVHIDKEGLAKLLINVKDKLQAKKPEEGVPKISRTVVDYLLGVEELLELEMEKQTDGGVGRERKEGRRRKMEGERTREVGKKWNEYVRNMGVKEKEGEK